MKKDKLLILMKNQKDCKLLREMLNEYYDILSLDQLSSLQEIDLIITDYYFYSNQNQLISRIIEKQRPLLLPLLVVSRKEKFKFDEQKLISNLNEIIKIPISKSVLLKKIKKLLELRFYSKQAEKKYDLIVQNSPVGIIVVNSGTLRYSNPYTAEILGGEIETLINSNSKLKALILESNSELKNYELQLQSGTRKVWLLINSKEMPYQEADTWIYIIKDITEQKEKEEKIKYMLYHDDLTNLYNRRFLSDNLLGTSEILTCNAAGIIVLDINNLKLINETFDNQLGDQIIIKISKIIESATNAGDFLLRTGGDEFLIILPDKNLLETEAVMEKIKQKSEEKYEEKIQLSIGAGAAVSDNIQANLTAVIDKATENMYLNKLTENYSIKSHIIKSMLVTLQVKSFETEDHASRMDTLAILLGKKAGLSRYQLDELSMLAKLHDIGKVAIPESILKKAEKLDQEEFNLVKTHPEIGYRIVKTVPHLNEVAEGVLAHHERWDGQGYPQGLKKEEIPLIARIITIIDSFDVMTNERSYKKAYSIKYSLTELEHCAGSQFDPELVDLFLTEVVNEVFTQLNLV
ncbi:PAS domain S-box-containing protein/diguanylate cyclase (GGDEF)-like protein [Halanaerobium saccharolyticum]|uniref:PAS domain S-box-containing protein/diguanylate cyclase (GGDEF)-like protein n=1 Tax=Halanaerobium saccharolyticum TaxID=43595 RepID=A0A4V3G3Y4_9FIRM|nr:HD domain-containing phosphohydrolase [Halanaerobium saccharolyticum]RAK04870.1 PAS domain S-box-containing protein/diguanylate cyclase (GGDEF)-like protein [Halanaerobium saccharolyticum]TDV98267.1 PAS domain S-box-containing protein/diguanylate cyclase (GGDEF)-like protein [Halanaerobium saccharolyticum]TDX51114.1 PAS domain S-box-containing protein/diguanylate cyclase (GGDEF)-like protein [Halanaerobium saccharolyticum]